MDGIILDHKMSESNSNKLQTVFRKNRDKLVGFIRKRINDISVAEDIAQDVFYKLSDMVDVVDSMEAWIYAVARNRVKDYYKKIREVSIDNYMGDDNELKLPGMIADAANMPDSLYTREAIWEELESALDELPESQKEAFVLHEFENFTVKEIAAIQNVSVNTVLSRKRYAVKMLRERLNKFYNELNF